MYKNIDNYSILNKQEGGRMLNIDTEYKRGILFVRLQGVLNKDTSVKLNKLLECAIIKAGIKYLMINFEQLVSIDEIGLEVINKNCLLLINNEGKLLTCGYNNKISLIIENSSFNNLIYKTNNEVGAFNIISI